MGASCPPEQRLAKRLKLNFNTGCIEWQGKTTDKGYGRLGYFEERFGNMYD